MLTISFLGTSLQVTTVSSTTHTNTWTLQFRYLDICTNFDHPSGTPFFTGKGRLQGSAWRVGTVLPSSSFSQESLSTIPNVTLTITTATAIANTAGWIWTAQNLQNPFSAAYSSGATQYTNLAITATCVATFHSPNNASGEIRGEFRANNNSDSLGNSNGEEDFFLDRTGTCPV